MFTRTIEHAVNNTVGAAIDRAEPRFNEALADANRHAEEARREMTEHLEFGTYVIAGAILTGFLVLAILTRTGN